ncbi:MAG: thioredoxin family protein, partial [Sphingomonadaceae bacterium]
MVSTETSVCDFGWKAVEFDLPGVDGKRHTLASARGPNGLLVMFICNHCPYVKAVIDKIVRDMAELRGHGVGSIAIMSNDPADYPEDSFANMQAVAQRHGFPFPYVYDETQAVAKAYGAVCTPD